MSFSANGGAVQGGLVVVQAAFVETQTLPGIGVPAPEKLAPVTTYTTFELLGATAIAVAPPEAPVQGFPVALPVRAFVIGVQLAPPFVVW